MSYKEQASRFKENLQEYGNFEVLFELLPDIFFYVKDQHYKLIMCNQANLRLLGLKEKSELIGKSEYDFFPQKLAEQIHEDDIMVMEQKQSIVNRMELIVDETGSTIWVSTNKIPLYKRNGDIAGLMGTTRILEQTDMIPEPYKRYAKTLNHIKQHYNEPISIDELAKMNHLSTSQFRNNFIKLFKLPPQKFILKIRIQAACQKLSSSQEEIATIAQDCGFCDQSYFTRQFRTQLGIPPKKYRELYSRKK